MQDWVQLARYGHLPVGNLGGDWLLDIADAHFARCLRDCGHLLWVTDPSLPDVASRGDDDAGEDLLLSPDPAPLEVQLRPLLHLQYSTSASYPCDCKSLQLQPPRVVLATFCLS